MANLGLNPFHLAPVDLGGGGAMFLPHVDVREMDDAVHIQADLPGVRARDVHLEALGGVLTLRADRRGERAGEAGNGQEWETFERSIPLASGADPRQATARFDRGELTVTVPRSAGGQSGHTRIVILAA